MQKIEPSKVLGYETKPLEYTFESKDAILYALGNFYDYDYSN